MISGRMSPLLFCRIKCRAVFRCLYCGQLFNGVSFAANTRLYQLFNLSDRSLITSASFFASKRKARAPIKFRIKSELPPVYVWPNITINDLAALLNVSSDELIEFLLTTEYANDVKDENQEIEDRFLLPRICVHFGHRLTFINRPSKYVADSSFVDLTLAPPPQPSTCVPRPPVITIMGHVDHGKTTLLDALRSSNLVDGEFGGITQHIGAFSVSLPLSDKRITFLDTPGHAAFSSMRQRGAMVTDIVVLVVAADDGVMNQTKESIQFARDANVPLLVAVNKIDKFNADLSRVKRELLAMNVDLEEFGGSTQLVEVSAKTGKNIMELQEAIIAQAEVMQISGDERGNVEGAVIESKTVPGKGKVATVLVQRGVLKKGSCFVAGNTWCKVRTLHDELNKALKSVKPGTFAEISGWREALPSAGDVTIGVKSESRAKEVVKHRLAELKLDNSKKEFVEIERQREATDAQYREHREKRMSLGFKGRYYDKNFKKTKEKIVFREGPSFPFLLRVDVDGSLDAILNVFSSYHSKKCKLDLIDSAVGMLTAKDVENAQLFNGQIYCFNVINTVEVEAAAQSNGINVKHFNVIYRLIEDIKLEVNKLLPDESVEEVLGDGKVIAEFKVSEAGKKVSVAGVLCEHGQLSRRHRVRVLRGAEIIYEGGVISMKRNKEVVNSATVNEEVGILVEDRKVVFEKNDLFICYEIVSVRPEIDWHPPGF